MSRHYKTIQRQPQRQGITLLEILISIGVLSIGLLGVLALLPAASQQAKAGAMQDAAAMMGRRAFREMNVRWQGRDEMYTTFGPAFAASRGDAANDNQLHRDRFYCIDPVGALLNESVLPPSEPTPALHKLILPSSLGGVASANRVVIAPLLPQGTPNPLYIKPEMYDMVFRSKDDLDFGEFASRENPAPNPPQQVALKNNSGLGVKRYATGGLSWFATVVAKNDGYNTVSVAIVDKRTSVQNADGTTTDAVSEQLLGSSMQDGTGDIEISMPASVNPSDPNLAGKEEIWSAVKPGHWILLAHVDPNEVASPSPGNDTAEWYRIQAIGQFDSTDGARRAITVAGNPWNADIANTRAIVVPNVIAVYSRSVAR